MITKLVVCKVIIISKIIMIAIDLSKKQAQALVVLMMRIIFRKDSYWLIHKFWGFAKPMRIIHQLI